MTQEAHEWPHAVPWAFGRTVDQRGCGSVAMAAVDRGLQVGASWKPDMTYQYYDNMIRIRIYNIM